MKTWPNALEKLTMADVRMSQRPATSSDISKKRKCKAQQQAAAVQCSTNSEQRTANREEAAGSRAAAWGVVVSARGTPYAQGLPSTINSFCPVGVWCGSVVSTLWCFRLCYLVSIVLYTCRVHPSRHNSRERVSCSRAWVPLTSLLSVFLRASLHKRSGHILF